MVRMNGREEMLNMFLDLQVNTCDQNLNRCCEIMELNSAIQGQLFTILNQTAREGELVAHSVWVDDEGCMYFGASTTVTLAQLGATDAKTGPAEHL